MAAVSALVSSAVTLLKYAPTIISNVVTIFKSIKEIRKKVNYDTVLREDTLARISSTNTKVLKIALVLNESVSIPFVSAVSDFPEWQRYVSEFLIRWHDLHVQPRFIQPMTVLLLLVPPKRIVRDHNVSAYLGYYESELKTLIAALSPTNATKANDAWATISSFLNEHVSIFTPWEGQSEDTMSDVNPEEDLNSAAADGLFSKESLLSMITEAKNAFLAISPSQQISNTDALFVWSPTPWIQGATDDTLITNMVAHPLNIDITNWSAVGSQRTGFAQLIGLAHCGDQANAANWYCNSGRPENIDNFHSAYRYASNSGEVANLNYTDSGNTSVGTEAFSTVVTTTKHPDIVKNWLASRQANLHDAQYRISYARYKPRTNDRYLGIPLRELPKFGNYDWWTTIKVELDGHSGMEFNIFYQTLLMPEFGAFNSLTTAVKRTEWKHVGSVRNKATHSGPSTHLIDLEIPTEWANENQGYVPVHAVQIYLTATDTTGMTDRGAGWWRSEHTPDERQRTYAKLSVEGVSSIPTFKPVNVSLVSYYPYDDPSEQHRCNTGDTFYDYFGRAIFTTGEDPNLSLYAVWARRLGERGIALNTAFRFLYQLGETLGVNVWDKYISAGLNTSQVNNLMNSQSWILTDGPFYDTTLKKPIQRKVVDLVLQYLWSDLLTLEYFATQNAVAEQVSHDVRGSVTTCAH